MKLNSSSASVSSGSALTSAISPVAPARGSVVDRPATGSGARFWCCLSLAAVVAAVGLSPVLLGLWGIWTDDPLRSIGMLIVPAGVILTLRIWRDRQWELNGSWWGALLILAALLLSNFHRTFSWYLVVYPVNINLVPPKLSLYLFASGVVILFGGVRVWRQAWFPLALLLFAQPVPTVSSRLFDLPLQSLSAHIARSFAVLIGFPPSSRELLRLMFTPDFGMFIAPGCDGLRGAVTLGYSALIIGYLKRVSVMRWALYVVGAVLLGYLFNLIRLCALVLYYRVALGHYQLEHWAKQADYLIGGTLILIASILLIWIGTRETPGSRAANRSAAPDKAPGSYVHRAAWLRLAVFASLALLFVVPGVAAIRTHQKSFAASIRDGELTPDQLDALMPAQIGGYKRRRVLREEINGRVAVESAAYSTGAPGEVVLGVWLLPSPHTMHESWRARGEDPQQRSDRAFATAGDRSVRFDSAFYSDGVTDSFAGNAVCTPSSCLLPNRAEGVHLEFTLNPIDFGTRGNRAVSMFFRVEQPHENGPQTAIQSELSSQAAEFLSSADLQSLSQRFQ